AVAFGAALAGAAIIGPVGALLALPAAAIIQAFVSSFLQRHDLVDHDLVIPEIAAESNVPTDSSGETA
ncbi:MAG TPA: AI-2E family transporter, partial [Acidimicrobiaceae bacterium]|nr:AI-2E family transporter [Acidimicrobiaceae bacterium]